ncbi:hypothetical protein [uncultured Clostridium sp.]|uniref:hypothetical protein n=1 Tax=uncultured Clostridium sp. TaxID=59620 RepID=UPI0028EDBFFC|nr:hypothetical protein [uncultured Clostridium sp.]
MIKNEKEVINYSTSSKINLRKQALVVFISLLLMLVLYSAQRDESRRVHKHSLCFGSGANAYFR